MSLSGSNTIACHVCGQNSRVMHHILHFKTVKSLCTNCVLHLHRGFFCSICFEVYENTEKPASDVILKCMRCLSSSHATCTGSHPNICNMCANPDSPLPVFYDMSEWKKMDKKAARALLAACKISTDSMRKAALAANVEAEVKVKEAIAAKEKAKKAADNWNALISKQNQ